MNFLFSLLRLAFLFFGGTFLSKQSTTNTRASSSLDDPLTSRAPPEELRLQPWLVRSLSPSCAPRTACRRLCTRISAAARRAFFLRWPSNPCAEQDFAAIRSWQLVGSLSNPHPWRLRLVVAWWHSRRSRRVSWQREKRLLMDRQETEMESASSPTRSAQEVLRRMSLNSPPSRADNPRQVKRPKVRPSPHLPMYDVWVGLVASSPPGSAADPQQQQAQRRSSSNSLFSRNRK